MFLKESFIMEIERKWLVNGWPEEALPEGEPPLKILETQAMRQGYISVEPTVRIREEKNGSQDPVFILCFKSGGGLAREEIEFPISEENFRKLEKLIGLPLVPKTRKTYQLSDGCRLEVNQVDASSETAFWYAEIEFASVSEARAWTPQEPWLAAYLANEVTETPGYSMGAYWRRTRLSNVKPELN